MLKILCIASNYQQTHSSVSEYIRRVSVTVCPQLTTFSLALCELSVAVVIH
jgi:hypothetical protein